MRPRSRIQTTGPNNRYQLRDYSKSSNRSESPLICHKQLGFRPATVGHSRGYYVVRITPEERKQRAVSMGYDAWKQQVSAASKDTDVTDVTDVS